MLRTHLQEWAQSAVSPELENLNVQSIAEFEPLEHLLYNLPNSARRNDGRVRDSWLKKYSHTYAGGWWVSGVDVLTGEDSLWGQFKPDHPRRYHDGGKERTIKYEAPPKTDTEIFAARVTPNIWLQIATRYLTLSKDQISSIINGKGRGFWQFVGDRPEIGLVITEGAKKAASLLTAGYCAVSIPGIYNGIRQPKNALGEPNGAAYLIPQLEFFAQEGREIIFCFDNDTKPQTVANVQKAIAKTGALFQAKGCKVSVISWNYPEKGVDDLIFRRGKDCFQECYDERKPLVRTKINSVTNLASYRPLYTSQRFLDGVVANPEASLLGIKSAKGTGKTQWLSQIAEKAINNGQRVLVLTHRETLATALAERFGIDYRTDVKTSPTHGALGYSLCVDSLHQQASPRFYPDEWQNAIVVIDEAEQVFWHMLDSSTCRSNRIAIIDSFRQLCRTVAGTGGQIYLADADLSPIALNYVEKSIGFPIKTWVVENQVKPVAGQRTLTTYTGSDPSGMLSELKEALEFGQKVLIHTTGQKAKSKFGTINLETYLRDEFPSREILRIDSESVSEPGHPAYGVMKNLNSRLLDYDIVICSPVVETGISIDIKGHFDSVWCIAYGVQTVDAVGQTLERLRDDVPRHLWAKATAKGNRIGNGATTIRSLLASQHKLAAANIRLLQQCAVDDLEDLDVSSSPESLYTWAKRAMLINTLLVNYRQEIINKLEDEGYLIRRFYDFNVDEAIKLNIDLKETRDMAYKLHCAEVAMISSPDHKELEVLKKKRAKTKEKRLSERKGNLENLYGVEVTPELVEKDDKGWHPQLQLHYYLTVGGQYLAKREEKAYNTTREQGKGKGFKPDINKKQLGAKVKALELLEIKQFLNSDAEFTKDNLKTWKDKAVRWRFDIKTALGVSIHPEKDSAIAIAQRILKKLGLKLGFKKWAGGRANKHRVYSGCDCNPDSRNLVFEQWLARDAES